MTTSFDDLVEQLLYDIALAGSKGIDAKQLERAVKAFYSSRKGSLAKSSAQDEELLFSDAPPVSSTIVDDRLVNAVWEWLEKQPDVQVDVVESANSAQSLPTQGEAEQTAADVSTSSKHAGKRIFTSADRIWQVIAGHGPDNRRVPGKEFDLLCIIAAHGPAGILQPELRRLSQQDKRSVPKRTDRLAAQGYISKDYVIADSMQTSLLTLWKFASKAGDAAPSRVTAFPQIEKAYELQATRLKTWYNETIRMLKENNGIIAVKDLRIGLGVYGNGRKADRMSYDKCIQRLVEAGYIRKLKAKDEAPTKHADCNWLRCIQQLRELTENDRLAFANAPALEKRAKLKQTAAIPRKNNEVDEFDNELDDEPDFEHDEDGNDETEPVNADKKRISPQWTPDLPIDNLVFNIIDNAGTEGISSMELNALATGPLWRRQLDDIMATLTDIWQTSQPAHLRHLGIVKERCLVGKNAHFKYYTLVNFEKLVETGSKEWKAVTENLKTPQGKSKIKIKVSAFPPLDLDEWGFQKPDPKLFTDKDGRASLLECQAVAREDLRRKTGTNLDRSLPQDGPDNVEKTAPHKEGLESTVKDLSSKRRPKPRDPAPKPPKVRKSTENESVEYAKRVREIAESIAQAEINAKPKMTANQANPENNPPKRKRGRPRKNPVAATFESSTPDESRIREIEKEIIAREKPGVYIHPPGAQDLKLDTIRKPGRPKSKGTLVAVFKSERLRDLPWFNDKGTEKWLKRRRKLSSSGSTDDQQDGEDEDGSHRKKRRFLDPLVLSVDDATIEDDQQGTKSLVVRLPLGREFLERFTKTAEQNDVTEAEATGESLVHLPLPSDPPENAPKSLIVRLPVPSEPPEAAQESLVVRLSLPSTEAPEIEFVNNESRIEAAAETQTTDYTSNHTAESPGSTYDDGVTKKARRSYPRKLQSLWDEFPVVEGITVQRTAAGLAVVEGESKARQKRHHVKSSNIDNSLLMAPGQIFHGCSGTIGTASVIGKFSKSVQSVETFWKNYQAVPKDRDDILIRAAALDPGAKTFPTYHDEQFNREVDQVRVWEHDLVESKGVLGSVNGLVFINHGLKCSHTIAHLGLKTGEDDFIVDSEASKPQPKPKRSSPKGKAPSRPSTPVGQQNGIASHHASLSEFPTSIDRPLPNGLHMSGLSTPSQFTRSPVPSSYLNPNGSVQSLHAGPELSKAHMLSLPKHWEPELMNPVSPFPPPGSLISSSGPTHLRNGEFNVIDFKQGGKAGPEIASRSRKKHDYAVLAGEKRKRTSTYKTNKKAKTPTGDFAGVPVDLTFADDSFNDPDYTPASKSNPVKKTKAPIFPEPERLIIAIALVKILSGGAQDESRINWSIVDHALSFKYGAFALQNRWRYQKKTSEDLCKELQNTLREPFLEAYDKGGIPTVDFDSPQNTDWPALVRWAETELWPSCNGEGYREIRDLPASRQELERGFHIETHDQQNRSRASEAIVLAKKSGFLAPNNLAFEKTQNDDPVGGDTLVAMSWARAVAMTSDRDYEQDKAIAKLTRLDNETLNKATARLVETRTLVRKKEGRRLEGRNFLISTDVLSQFRRWPGNEDEYMFLRKVAAARDKLIGHFEEHDQLVLDSAVSEPENFVLTEMLAQGHITIKVMLPDSIRDLASSIVHADPSTFSFPVMYSKTQSFTRNHGLESDVPIPRNPPGSLRKAMPMWIDIHNNFLDSVWDMVLRSVLHLVVFSPGSTAKTIEKAHGGHIWAWEIELMLQWMEEVGLVQKLEAGGDLVGMKATEWWYCAFLPEIATWKAPAGT